jgi:hypothetical protein
MALASLRFKRYLAIWAVLELSQTRQRGFHALAQIGDDLLQDNVQPVGGFALAHARPPGQLSCDVRLSHLAITVAAGELLPHAPRFGEIAQISENKSIVDKKNPEGLCDRQKTLITPEMKRF